MFGCAAWPLLLPVQPARDDPNTYAAHNSCTLAKTSLYSAHAYPVRSAGGHSELSRRDLAIAPNGNSVVSSERPFIAVDAVMSVRDYDTTDGRLVRIFCPGGKAEFRNRAACALRFSRHIRPRNHLSVWSPTSRCVRRPGQTDHCRPAPIRIVRWRADGRPQCGGTACCSREPSQPPRRARRRRRSEFHRAPGRPAVRRTMRGPRFPR